MIRAGVGFSSAPNPRNAASEATAAALAQAGLHSATGALCFVTPAYGAAYPMILRTVASEANTRDVVGCSGMGVIAGEKEVESGNALAVLVFGGDEIHATRFFVPTLRGRAAGVATDIAAAVRPHLSKSNLLIVLADSYNFEAEATLAALGKELPGVPITGGGASEDGSIGETFVFCGDTVSSNAVSGMLLSGDFALTIASSIACTPIGPPHRVTAVRDNILLELDGRPATVTARLGYLLQRLRPDITELLPRPSTKTWFGPRRPTLRHDNQWQIADTLLPFDPRHLERAG